MSFDAQTAEYAVDTLDRIQPLPVPVRILAGGGALHAGLAVIAEHLGHDAAASVLADARAELDRWLAEGLIDA